MEEFLKTLNSWLKEKTSSGLYFTFIFFYITWNWKFFYFIFIEDSSLLDKTRIEYIIENNLDFSFFHFLVPCILTFLSIQFFPIIYNWAHRISVDNYFSRSRIYYDELLRYEQYKTNALLSISAEKQEQTEITKNFSEEDKWKIEFSSLMKNEIFTKKFKQVISSIYEKSGYVTANQVRYIDVDILSLSHINNLIEYTDDSSRRIQLTNPKGKFFANLYSVGDINNE